MRQSLKVRIGMLVLVTALAMPALAAPKRDDSPFDQFERTVANFVDRIIHCFDVIQISPPK